MHHSARALTALPLSPSTASALPLPLVLPYSSTTEPLLMSVTFICTDKTPCKPLSSLDVTFPTWSVVTGVRAYLLAYIAIQSGSEMTHRAC